MFCISSCSLFQISLNETHPLEGTPSVRAVSAVHSENLVWSNAKASTTTQRSLFHNSRHDKNKKFAPTTSSKNQSDSITDSPTAKNGYNIVPGALTERDVQRLAWAVQRVRSIVRDMRLQDLSMLAEVSPGSQVGHRLSSTNGFSGGNSSSNESTAESKEQDDDKELAEWVSSSFPFELAHSANIYHSTNYDYRSARMHFCSQIGSVLLQWGRACPLPLLLSPAATRTGSGDSVALYVRTLQAVMLRRMIILTTMSLLTTMRMKTQKVMERTTWLPAHLWWTSTSVSGTFSPLK